ncbi:Dimethylaniline monooxygenase [N-oxide-forming] 5 [Araneus ventricosus]|uniref:Flavin-containing monooxygenase n=1 Tax=Araneus ventricosus TaxID=182803 RepID=A0A4Y2GLH6_ARAVE|nr:Dimethylaniline monooxygenase [N-oxide-forming] 5 [Araneus ventricosus]
MTPKNKKIAVIGAGGTGLASLAALEEEGGFDAVCFEKTDKPGGTWCYRENPEVGVGSTMPTTILNHSKEMGALSNFPPKKESNNFMRRHEIYEYIMDYATSRNVLKYIRYKMEVLKVKRYDDYEETGKWTVTVKNRLSGGTSTDVYDGVLVCIGHYNRPKVPSYPSQDLFKGKIMHTYSLKEVAPYKDKTVVVVGMGCSGLDAAVETSNVAKQVTLHCRKASFSDGRDLCSSRKFAVPVELVTSSAFSSASELSAFVLSEELKSLRLTSIACSEFSSFPASSEGC